MISIGNLQINKLCLGDVEVTKAYLGDVEVYDSNKKYMTMTVLDGDAGTTIAPKITGSISPTPNLQYRVNNSSWNDFIVGTNADIHAAAGDVVQFKGLNPNGISTYSSNYLNFAISGNPVALSGNVMSLIDGVGDALVIPNSYCFYKMFSKSNVKTVSSDFLPATELTNSCYEDLFSESLLENGPELPALTMKDSCYRGMFYGCQHFTQAPALHSTELAYCCYMGTFQNCPSLVNPPEILPALTLKERCYYLMFSGSAITNAPEISATVLDIDCCNSMFQNCTALVNAPALHSTTVAGWCYDHMFAGCTSLTTAPALNATTVAGWCYDHMFAGCTKLVTAPELPANNLADYCYNNMFYGCSSLVTAPELPATTLVSYCYQSMFSGCTALKQAPELPATTLVDYCYQYMFYNCSNLNYVKSLATNITATNALYQWLSGVASSGTFEKPAGVTYQKGSSGIPENWTVVEEKPKPVGKYMTMTVLDGEAGTTISPTVKGTLPNLNLQYRINSNGDWTNFIVGTTADIQVVSGDWVQFKGVNESGISSSDKNYMNFSISGNPVALSGNVMSLIDGVGDRKDIPCDYCFYKLFETSQVKNISPDFLPATTLKNGCYHSMFFKCNTLVQGPSLPATKLADNCYEFMFWECTSLTTAPALPATTLAKECYSRMFWKCTSLVNVPEILPATTLADSCYIFMFYGCTSLVKAPELPATKLISLCYQSMFSGCTSLNYVKCLATSGTINNGGVPMTLYNWLYNVAPTGTFVKPAGVEYVPNSKGGIPSGWTIQNI